MSSSSTANQSITGQHNFILTNPKDNFEKADVKQKMSPEEIATAQAKGNLIYSPIVKDGVATASQTTYDVSGGTWTNRMSKEDKKRLRKNRKQQLKAMKAARADNL